jgi:hypothetical protein
MTGHSSTSGITMQHWTGIRATQRQRNAWQQHRRACASQQQQAGGEAGHRKPDRWCIALLHTQGSNSALTPGQSHCRPCRVPEHVARWLWLQLRPRRLAACVASAPELRDRTLFVSSVRVDSGQCSDVLLSRARKHEWDLVAEAVAVAYLTDGVRLSLPCACNN